MDSTVFFDPFQVVYMNFATKNLLACLCFASSTVETMSMVFPYLVNFYLQIQNSINITSPLSLQRDSFITLDLDNFLSALTLNLAFLPQKLIVSHTQEIL